MELVLAPEVWIVAVVTAATCGWIFGDLHGFTRRLIAQDALDHDPLGESIGQYSASEGVGSLFSLTIAPKIAEPKTGPKISPKTERMADTLSARHHIFAEMPPVDQLRDQARHILQSDNVWTDPDIGERLNEFTQAADQGSSGLLSHYRSSIEELQRTNISRDTATPMRSIGRVGETRSSAELASISEKRLQKVTQMATKKRGQETQPRSSHIAYDPR